ncbi:SMI1/KNR4 family protein [Roseiconus nitratireducens]|uniref:SMI1/KNR4 family protein n=1 Tax=Roseiconus nitratireducens TaxID=2605748 RepID=A0A5M6CYC6_9BACT|nr:SMI1/KNR4 family protein [Roseiconus nitratireducens]KAA5540228.1 SMI1/KNR4 family protein [Roseiconus nitratireducens]
MHQSQKPSGTPRPWSRQIQARYECQLSDDLIAWFDDAAWQLADGQSSGEFCFAVPPEQLLCDAPPAIWPALMPCDFLPVLGNDMGDWLCIRVGDDGSTDQIIHWYHGGGDWIPWGNSLSQAILFDQVRGRLPGSRGHAVAPLKTESTSDPAGGDRRLAEWAIGRLSATTRTAAKAVATLQELSGYELANALLEQHWCEPAVRCQMIIDALANRWLTPEQIQSWQLDDADQVQQWLFDNRRIAPERLSQIASQHGISVDQLLADQSWADVAMHCRHVVQSAPELSWGYELLGYSHEREGEIEQAIELYRRGLNCSVFTDQTVRVRTHGFDAGGQKFSATRLQAIGYRPAGEFEREYLQRLGFDDTDRRREAVQSFFSDLAAEAERQGDPGRAHRLWCRAGWDLGAEPMTAFAELLSRTTAAAKDAGRPAMGAVAATHRECFRQRYGL